VKYKRILTIPRGKQVQYVSKKGSWYKVKYASKTGYVSSAYLTKESNVSNTSKTSSSPKPGYVKKVMDVEVTAYTFRKGANRTASGKKLQVGYVSAPREISFGSIVDIPGIEKQLGVAELKVYDRGGAIKRLSSNKIRIDVAFPTRSGALKFGRKTYKNVTIYVKK
jgi:3D (Asp-Asp-Asp) domain-containing protein